jgi:RHS repeat-associated protein
MNGLDGRAKRASICAWVVFLGLFSGAATAGFGVNAPDKPKPPLFDPPCQQMCCGFGGGGFGGGGGGWGSSGPGGFGGGSHGKPVLVWDGSERLSETDLVLKSTFPIRIVRRYNSAANYDSTLGYGWAFQHDRAVFEYPDSSIVMRTGCGTREEFLFTAGAFVTPPNRTQGALTKNGDGTIEFRYYDGTRDVFDPSGRLVREYDTNGFSHEFLYAAQKLDLKGVAYKSPNPSTPTTVAKVSQLMRIQERAADGSLTGVYADFTYYATTGRLQRIQSNDGRSVTYTQDVLGGSTRGNLVRVDAPAGMSHVYGYADSNDVHNLTSIQRGTRAGIEAYVNVYDNKDRVLTQTHGASTLTFAYDVAGDQLKRTVTEVVKDDQGVAIHTAVTLYQYLSPVQGQPEADGRIDSIVDANFNKTQYFYDAQLRRRAIELRKPDGTVVRRRDYTFDSEARVLTDTVTLATGEVVTKTYTYDMGRVLSQQTTSSLAPTKLFRTEYDYYRDGANKPIRLKEVKRRVCDAGQGACAGGPAKWLITTYFYDSKGRLEKTVMPDGVELRNGYGAGPLPTSIQYYTAAGVPIPEMAQTLSYDPDNQLNTVTDASNAVTDYDYDDLGRLASVINPLGQKTIYTYTDDLLTQREVGNTVADGEGQVTRYVFDGRGRKIRTERKKEDGTFVTFESFFYDSASHLLRRLNGAGQATTYTYDKMGQVLTVKDALNHTTTYQYDEAGNRTKKFDANNHETEYVYDKLDRLIETKQKGASETLSTKVAYDAVGNQLSITDAKNQVTQYTYDEASRKLSETKPLSQATTYTYDDRSRPLKTVNARGQAIVNEYETWGPLKAQRHYAEAAATTLLRTIIYTRDLVGNVTATSDDAYGPGNLWTAQYDLLRRQTMLEAEYAASVMSPIRAQSNFDRFGNVQSESTRLGMQPTETISFVYDKRNRLATATSSAGGVTLVHDEADRRLSIDYPSGRKQTFSWNADSTMQSTGIQVGKAAADWHSSYTYDPAHNVSAITATEGNYAFLYDDFDRLTNATYPASLGLPTESYTYDPVGNRELQGNPSYYDYDSNNRMTQGPASYGYDADGSQTSALTLPQVPGANQRTSTYDVGSRLSQIVDHANGAPTSTDSTYQYAYDPLGRRIRASATVNGSTTNTYYLWNGDRIVAEFGDVETRLYQYLPGDYSPVLAKQDAAMWYGVHADRLDTPRLLTDKNNVIKWRGFSSAFGANFGAGQGNPVNFNIRFPGQIRDGSGLYYNRFRDYDSDVGRYVESDPIGLKDGPNTYLYVRARPTFTFDPFGLTSYSGFPPGTEDTMKNAVDEAIRKMRQCTACTDCGPGGYYNGWCISEYDKERIIQGLEGAQFRYRAVQAKTVNHGDVCANNVNGNLVDVYPAALAGSCCGLSSTLAHEAGHIAELNHQQIFYYEQVCFGCKPAWDKQ